MIFVKIIRPHLFIYVHAVDTNPFGMCLFKVCHIMTRVSFLFCVVYRDPVINKLEVGTPLSFKSIIYFFFLSKDKKL